MPSVIPSLLVLSSLTSLGFVAGGDEWLTNFEAAKTIAKKEKKDLLIDFTGSDWCGWCIKLKGEVFDQDAFKKEILKHFVLVEIDFPRAKELTPEVKAQNEALKTQFALLGFPTIFLTDADGRPYAKTGYKAGGPEKDPEHLAELRKTREARDAAFAKAAKERGAVERARLLDEVLGAIDLPDETRATFYAATIEEIMQLDADGKAGLKPKYELAAEVRKVKASVQNLMRERRTEEAIQELRKLVDGKKPTGKVGWDLHFMLGQTLLQAGDLEAAIKALEKAKALEPENSQNKAVDRIIETAKQQVGGGGKEADGLGAAQREAAAKKASEDAKKKALEDLKKQGR